MYGKAPKEYLSLWSVIALGIGSMVGAGIFALMGQATLMAGKNVYWSFILGGVAALLSGYTYAKLGSRYPGSGGIMDYFNEAFSHKTLSGALTLIYLGTLVITVALVAKSFGAYASRLFLPDRAVTIYSTALFASVAILLLGALNMGGARAVGKSEVIMVAFKLLILTVLMLASFGSSVPVGADPIPVKGLDGLLGSVGLTFFAFAGYGMMANTAGNLKNPSRTLPRAIFMAIGLVLALYLILSYVVLSNVPATSLESHTETAVAQAAYPVLGMWGFMAVSVAALIATASAINATMFSMLDISRALARNGALLHIVIVGRTVFLHSDAEALGRRLRLLEREADKARDRDRGVLRSGGLLLRSERDNECNCLPVLELRALIHVLTDDDALGLTAVFIGDARLRVKLRKLRLGRLLGLADKVGQDALAALVEIKHAGQCTDHDRDECEHRRDRGNCQAPALAHAPDAAACETSI